MPDTPNLRMSCENCGGEGTLYSSRYGGNDPDVWPVGKCSQCDGTGIQQCEDCGDAEATREYQDPQHTKNRFKLCKACFDEWTKEDEEATAGYRSEGSPP